MKKIFLILILCLSGSIAIAQPAKQKVAVYVTGDVENSCKKVIGSKLVTGITRSAEYAAIERTTDFLAELNKEQDYQMSGAVSDNQIARLGQQFGVRYVLIADVSEVFESIFISARMIDVQTAQIIRSTESSSDVINLNSLTKISEDVVLDIVCAQQILLDINNDVKLINVAEYDDLRCPSCPQGFHLATYDEIINLIENAKVTGKKLHFPIYVNCKYKCESMVQTYNSICYYKDKHGNQITKFNNRHSRAYYKNTLSCNIIENINSKDERLELVFFDDDNYNNYESIPRYLSDLGLYVVDEGVSYMGTSKPKIKQGYVYAIKNMDNK